MEPIDWLLDSDPAIRWQAVRDLTDASEAEIARERARVAHEGLGARILACQEPDGAWRLAGSPTWLPTLFTFLLLRSAGVDRADPVVESAVSRLDRGLRWGTEENRWDLRDVGSNSFFAGETEPCINGGALALGGYFGRPTASLADRLLAEQLEDGGWNCDAPASKRSSFHTTICVLEGLLEYERAAGPSQKIAAARRRGEEYLLERSLFRRRSSGAVASQEFLELAFPPRYHYDILRALDHLRNAGAAPDARMSEAVRLIESKRLHDGRWPLERAYDEALGIALGEAVGEPSRWNTLRALRVLRWYENGAAQGLA